MDLPGPWGLCGFSCNFRQSKVSFTRVSNESFQKLNKARQCDGTPRWPPGDKMNAWPPLGTKLRPGEIERRSVRLGVRGEFHVF